MEMDVDHAPKAQNDDGVEIGDLAAVEVEEARQSKSNIDSTTL